MYLLKILFYQFYRFASRLNDGDPEFYAFILLSFLLSLTVNAVVETIAVIFFCYKINLVIRIGLLILSALFINKYFLNSKRLKAILKRPPYLLGSPVFYSTILSFLMWLMIMGYLFWGPVLFKRLLEKCGP